SVYEPTQVLPMFPRSLSERAMSLVEGLIRPSVSFMMTLDNDLELVDFDVVLSWLKVTARMTYDFADAVMLNEASHPLRAMLDNLRLVSEQQLHRRLDRGAVILQIPEVKIRVEGPRENGTLMQIDTLEVKPLAHASPSRDLVQEMMVLTGNQVGRWMRDHHMNVLYRSQSAPDDPEHEELMRGTVFSLVESYQVRRKMKRSSTTLLPEPHFGLGFDVYVQVTSPIRRYADLLSHHQIHAQLRDDDQVPKALDVEALRELSAALDGLLGEASSVERESKRFWTLVYLKRQLGKEMEAIVVDVIDERRARALVFITDVALAVPTSLIRAVPVGESIRVRIDNVDPRRDLLVLKMLDASA
ncbi:MAG: RNB domain-containing ribonuclease, partial [Myxococcota bacterium]